ncbi:MAG: TIGR01777 family protein [Desulfobacteraceae bacterium]|nr:TIGR01777 family protein [Desulfobacteraceae bacterium]
MNILITGGSGFVGTYLTRQFLRHGYQVTAIGSRRSVDMPLSDDFSYVSADTTTDGPWQGEVAKADVIINLTGKSIFGRWNDAFKKQLYDSRILSTRHIVNALPEKSAQLLISASAIGYYGDCADRTITEETSAGDDFLARLSVEWENSALNAKTKGARVVIPRLGIVLGKNGGAVAQMVPTFKKYLGGPIGHGRQWFSWIHMEDLGSAMDFIITHREITGPVNLSAPGPVRNRDFVKALGHVLKRPASIPAPTFMLRLALGEFADTLLISQKMLPQALQKAGFVFQYPEVAKALDNLLRTDLAET